MTRKISQIVDRYLVSKARLGDRSAQAQLVTRFQARLLAHAYRLLDDSDAAKDCVQEAWLEILRGLPRLKDDAAFPAWSFRILTRRCARTIKARQKARTLAQRAGTESELQGHTSDDLAVETNRTALQQALKTLSPAHRAAVALFYLQEMSVGEVAVALEIPVGTVKSRLLTARQKLRDALERSE